MKGKLEEAFREVMPKFYESEFKVSNEDELLSEFRTDPSFN